MLIVKVFVNDRMIDEICILNRGIDDEEGNATYEVVSPPDSAPIIHHDRGLGWKPLFMEVLKHHLSGWKPEWESVIDSEGRLVIPVEVIDKLRWGEGDSIAQAAVGDSVQLSRVEDDNLDNIIWVCQKCGSEASGGRQFEVSCWHENVCDVCGEIKQVTEVRDFFYPDFSNFAKGHFGGCPHVEMYLEDKGVEDEG